MSRPEREWHKSPTYIDTIKYKGKDVPVSSFTGAYNGAGAGKFFYPVMYTPTRTLVGDGLGYIGYQVRKTAKYPNGYGDAISPSGNPTEFDGKDWK